MTALVLIFVVEDEPLILDMLEAPLRDGGYDIAMAISGDEAIAMLESETPACQALITDVNLGPGQPSGWDVARRARELNPTLPVVYMTGDSGQDWAANGVPNSILITKPFAPAQALTAVSQLLNASPVTTAPENKGP
jgi:CheY-like chemotaxis protein